MSTLTYVYCLVRSRRRPVLRSMPAGVPGSGDLRALDAGDGLWLIAATVPEHEYGESALARGVPDLEWVAPRAMAHEAVVERFLTAAALLPMKLFTLFTSDARALAHVAADRRRLTRILGRIEGHVEWGLRLAWDQTAMPRTPAVSKKKPSGQTGAAYLSRKRELLDLNRTRLRDAQSEANRIYRIVSREATDARRRSSLEQTTAGSRLLLDAAFLTPARQSQKFRTVVRRQTRAVRDLGMSVSLTGPWPPYNFIERR